MGTNEELVLLNLVKMGHGLGLSVRKAGITVKQIRDHIKQNPAFISRVKEVMVGGMSELIELRNQALKDKKISEIISVDETIKSFISDVPPMRQRRFFDPFQIVAELRTGRSLSDIAVMYNIEYEKLVDKIQENRFLRMEIFDKKVEKNSRVNSRV
jgi:hypothetical protein